MPSIPLDKSDAERPGGNYMKQERAGMTEGKETKWCPKCGNVMMEQMSDLQNEFVCAKDGTRLVEKEKEAA